MRVRATTAFSAVRDCQIIEFVKGQEVDGDIARYLLATGAAVEPVDDEASALADDTPEIDSPKTGEPEQPTSPPGPDNEPPAPPAPEFDITAKIDDVLAWVDGDKDRATTARDAEASRGEKTRPRLVAALTEIIDK